MRKRSVFLMIVVMPAIAVALAACAQDQASAPYSHEIPPGAIGGAGGGGGGAGGAGGM